MKDKERIISKLENLAGEEETLIRKTREKLNYLLKEQASTLELIGILKELPEEEQKVKEC